MADPNQQLQQAMNQNVEVPENQSEESNVTNKSAPTQKDVKLWQVSHRLDPVKVRKYLTKTKTQSDVIFSVGEETATKLFNDPKFMKMSSEQQKTFASKLTSDQYRQIIEVGNQEDVSSKSLKTFYDQNSHLWKKNEIDKWNVIYNDVIDKELEEQIDQTINNPKIDEDARNKQIRFYENKKFYNNSFIKYNDLENAIERTVTGFDLKEGSKFITDNPAFVKEYEGILKTIDKELKLLDENDAETGFAVGEYEDFTGDWKNMGDIANYDNIDDALFKLAGNKLMTDAVLQAGGIYSTDETGKKIFIKFDGILETKGKGAGYKLKQGSSLGQITVAIHQHLNSKLSKAFASKDKIKPYVPKFQKTTGKKDWGKFEVK